MNKLIEWLIELQRSAWNRDYHFSKKKMVVWLLEKSPFKQWTITVKYRLHHLFANAMSLTSIVSGYDFLIMLYNRASEGRMSKDWAKLGLNVKLPNCQYGNDYKKSHGTASCMLFRRAFLNSGCTLAVLHRNQKKILFSMQFFIKILLIKSKSTKIILIASLQLIF